MPPVSVIIYSRDGDEQLEELLNSIFEQEYDGPTEAIVVNDGMPTRVGEVVSRLQPLHRNLYMTYVPDNSRNLSRKKMAVTLGIKAASHDIVVLTCANCRIPSNQWLRSMATPFTRGKDMVIGYATPRSDLRPRLLAFDYLYSAVTYLSSGIFGHPYRGTEANLAYRKSLFYSNHGFSTNLNLNYGDDDIFVSQVATGRNTRVVLNPESVVDVMEYNPLKAHKLWRARYDFTRRFLHTSAPFAMGLGTLAWWGVLGCGIALSIAGLPSFLPLIIGAGAFVLMWLWLAWSWRKAGKALGFTPGWLTPLALLWHPLYGSRYRIKELRDRQINYTWGQQA